jgi:hypothetical protein
MANSERETQPRCRHCHKPICKNERSCVPALRWQHTDGFYNCDGYQGHAETYAEPEG